MLTVIAKMPIKEGKMDEALKEAQQLVMEVAKEQGTVLYSLNVEKANPNTLVVVEQYTDKDALNFHSSTPHFQEFFTKISVLLGGDPEIKIMKEIARAK
ncbi:MAG: antibiotic biosynthesis monooxygenase [Deltaproteobacteria bacterium HGW-Deltaproteobacteria-12]|jgi:quinol monooxygenase YgiN|nr:MAG: antibiotic biosynthesis monooxygenase [Deltaproteobacteria bacterium HGW-Deltaproteobacteria-12]